MLHRAILTEIKGTKRYLQNRVRGKSALVAAAASSLNKRLLSEAAAN
jgi:hypothetical protein